MSFWRMWLWGYTNPRRWVNELAGKPAPQWGFAAQCLRALMDAFLLYLPLAVMGRVPPTPSNLTFLPTERYYAALVWIAPLVLLGQWLLGGALIHIVLRLAKLRSDVDQILNITGCTALVVGAFLLLWDWLWVLAGGMDQIGLGISHLVIDLWGMLLTVWGLKKVLGVPVWLGVVLYVAALLAALPLAIMFMRSPV